MPSSSAVALMDGFLNFIEQMWSLHGTLPSQEVCISYGFTDTQYSAIKRRNDLQQQLIDRGIPRDAINALRGIEGGLQPLTEEQLTAVAVMLDTHDRRSKSKRLSELGLSTAKWNGWLKDPTFREYFTKRAENLLGENYGEADYALVQKVRTGDIGAIKYFNQFTGRFDPDASRHANANGTGFDPKAFIVRVMEAVQKHCSGDQQQAIADELLNYAAVSGFASRIIDDLEPINIPTPTVITGTTEAVEPGNDGANNTVSQGRLTNGVQLSSSSNGSQGSSKQTTRELVLAKLKAGGL